jgi:myosin-5
VFLKSHQAATLARLHTAALGAAATRIQSDWRAGQARAQFKATRTAVIKLQAGARGMAARRLAERLRREKAATALQVGGAHSTGVPAA